MIFISCIPILVIGQTNIEKIATNIVQASGSLLYDVYYAPLQRVLTPLILSEKSIKAVILTGDIKQKAIFRAYTSGDSLVYNEAIPQTFLSLEKLKRDIIYDDVIVGTLTIYFSNDNNTNLTVEEKNWLKKHPVIKVHNEKSWPPCQKRLVGVADYSP